MTRDEHILKVLEEECAEVAQRVSKALRFGIAETQQGQPHNNAERISTEVDDLIAAVEMCYENGLLPRLVDRTAVEVKKQKILKYLEYSREMGTLQ